MMRGICGCADPATEVSITNPETGVKTVLNNVKGDNESPSNDHNNNHQHEGDDVPHVHGPT